jgi:hypothetical protein
MGRCVDEGQVLYVAPNGVDSGTCVHASPCATIQYAVSKTSTAAHNIVVGVGAYVDQPTTIDTTTTSASSLLIHGTGAVLSNTTGENPLIWMDNVETTVIGILFDEGAGTAIQCGSAPCVLEHIKIRREMGIYGGSTTVLRDSEIQTDDVAIDNLLQTNSHLTVERSKIFGQIRSSGTVEITNTLVNSRGLAVDAPYAQGTISFSTITTTGNVVVSGPKGIRCGVNLAVRDSIIWTPGTNPPVAGGCAISNSIAGPVAVPGALAVDPQFAGLADFHLSANSPAKDGAPAGPSVDFEGNARPNGAAFDLGADELQ